MNDRQRTKVNALLCCIHGAGHDASAITNQANAYAGPGRNLRAGYERAINEFAVANPGVLPQLTRVSRLIDHSDPETVAHYDRALSAYIETGNEAALAPVAAIAARDSVELAVRDGDISAADAAAGRIDWTALGMDPATAQAAYAPEPVAGPPQSFAFHVAGKPDAAPAAPAPAAPQPGPAYIRTEAGYRSAPTGVQARREAGVPLGTDRTVMRDATGFRSVPTNRVQLAREVGLPLSLFEAGQTPS